MPEENSNQNNSGNNESLKENKESKFNSFEEFLSTVDEPIKQLYQKDISGLKTALDKERDDRKRISEKFDQLKEKAEKGSDLEKQLNDAQNLLNESENRYQEALRRANFAEQAIKPEIGCSNIKAAYAIAISDNLFDNKGNPDWKSIKSTAPELFKRSEFTDGGKRQKAPLNEDMNSILRQAAGIKEK